MATPDDMMTVDEAVKVFAAIGAEIHESRQKMLATQPEAVIQLDPMIFEMRQQAEALHPRVAEAFDKAAFPQS